jgi:WD40 repeat protein
VQQVSIPASSTDFLRAPVIYFTRFSECDGIDNGIIKMNQGDAMTSPTVKKITLAITVILLMACAISVAAPTAVPLEPTVLTAPSTAPILTPIPPTSQPAAKAPADTKILPENVDHTKEAAKVKVENPARLVWTLDSRQLAVLGQDTLHLLDAGTLSNQGSMVFTPPIYSLAFSPDGQMVASTSDQTSLDLRSPVDGKTRVTIKPQSQFSTYDFSPDGKFLITSSVDEISATIWDTANGQQVKVLKGFETAAPVYDVSFAPDGRSIIWHARAAVQLMDIESGRIGSRFEHEDFVMAVAMTTDGKLLVTAAGGTYNNEFTPLIKFWDTTSQSGSGVIPIKTLPYSNALAFSRDGRMLAAGVGASLVFWDTHTRGQIAEIPFLAEGITALAFSPDGNAVGVATSDGTISVWRIAP